MYSLDPKMGQKRVKWVKEKKKKKRIYIEREVTEFLKNNSVENAFGVIRLQQKHVVISWRYL